MKKYLDINAAAGYKSPSQIVRVLTENWVARQVFCPSCGVGISKYEHNRPVADFYCPVCKEEYELKSKADTIGQRMLNGAYKVMIERLMSNNNPHFFLLAYSRQNYEVLNFFVVPKYFFIPEIIEKRTPLSIQARRAGWVGCNIILKSIPQAGKIFYIRDKKILPKSVILESWGKTLFLAKQPITEERGWIFDVMKCIDRLGKKEFVLSELYAFEDELKSKHPRNMHIRAKIRQQMQILRDGGYLKFLSRGNYRLV